MSLLCRIIPAYAGSTAPPSTKSPSCRDHPRIRGEHKASARYAPSSAGSSPHTRGARSAPWRTLTSTGIIPAYAGSTRESPATAKKNADHPRIRGEHLPCGGGVGVGVGSSPHTRGARRAGRAALHSFGIIPAYAGSTSATALRRVGQADHPRIRGEHDLWD